MTGIWFTGLSGYYPPDPHCIGDSGADFDVASAISDSDSMWVVRPHLFCKCTLRPLLSTKISYNRHSGDIDFDLVFFSAFMIFACEPLAQYYVKIESNGIIRKLYAAAMKPRLSPRSMLAGWKTSLDGCHSFRATSMVILLPFRISTQHDRSRPSNSVVPTVKALHHAGGLGQPCL